MAAANTLTFNDIRSFLISKNGKVANRELVKHFKKYLTGPDTEGNARVKFKEYVNTLAKLKTEDGEKFVILRKEYFDSESVSPTVNLESPPSLKQPPPYRNPPPVTSPTPSIDSRDDISLDNISQFSFASTASVLGSVSEAPQVPPRRRSQDKLKIAENKENNEQNLNEDTKKTIDILNANAKNDSHESEQKISVKERLQKFNRMATETDSKIPSPNQRKKSEKGGVEDDGASVTSYDPKSREWFIRAAFSDYQVLAKLAAENPRLVKYKDPFTGYTALHWAAKHGNEDVVKLIAGTHKADVDVKTNGGYTPLHLAMQYGHHKISSLLIKVYGADSQIRDYSGRTPQNYRQRTSKIVRSDTFNKKDLSFLRIGSLNVRVKKTTEAFSNFLGVGSTTPSQVDNETLSKSWGSEDNISQKTMAPPITGVIKKRKSKRPQDFIVNHSTPTTPSQSRSSINRKNSDLKADSDSDTACGFDSDWKNTVE